MVDILSLPCVLHHHSVSAARLRSKEIGNQIITIRIKRSEKDTWQTVTLLGQQGGWAVVTDGCGPLLWVVIKTGHIHPDDITKLFGRPK